MTDTDFQAIAEAAAHFADIWAGLLRGELADNYGCALTCPEANAAADLYRALGLDDLADDIIAAHAERDTSQDQHYEENSTLGAGSRVLRRTAAALLQSEARHPWGPGLTRSRSASPESAGGSALPGFRCFPGRRPGRPASRR